MSQLRSIQPIKNGLGLRELQAVLAVAELGSFRAAAAALGFTQSALSHQVSALEAALGQSLFDRPGGRAPVRLTPAGEAVCRRARRALSEVEAVAADAEQAGPGGGGRGPGGGPPTPGRPRSCPPPCAPSATTIPELRSCSPRPTTQKAPGPPCAAATWIWRSP